MSPASERAAGYNHVQLCVQLYFYMCIIVIIINTVYTHVRFEHEIIYRVRVTLHLLIIYNRICAAARCVRTALRDARSISKLLLRDAQIYRCDLRQAMYLYLFWCWSLTCTLLTYSACKHCPCIAWDTCSRMHVHLKVHRALRSNTIVGVGRGAS
jgi:hypothetical protein